MIFTRARKYLQSRNYAAFFLEFFILVLGVFLSLQVNEWQNNRKNHELELQYLLRLENDFEKSKVALEQNIERIRLSLQNLESGLTILLNEQRREEDYQKLFTALQSSSITASFKVFFGTFEELKDTGNMRLIQSTKLRESLGNVWQKYLSISRISEIRNMLRGNTFPVMVKYVKPMTGNTLTFDAELVEKEPRELYIAMSILRTNLRNDFRDSEEVLELVNQTLDIVRSDIELR